MGHEELPIFVRWYKFVGWLFETTEKFPKSVRFTLSSRLNNFALDVLERIIEAAYSKNKSELLKRANMDVEKMRVLFRLSHDQRYINAQSYKYAVEQLYESGRMLGGWIKERKGQ